MKVNQHHDVKSGRQLTSVVLRSVVSAAAGLLLLCSGTAQGQQNSWTNVASGDWTYALSWRLALSPGTGANDSNNIIYFANPAVDLSTNDTISLGGFTPPGFWLNQLIIQSNNAVVLSAADPTQDKLRFVRAPVNNALPQFQQNSTAPVTLNLPLIFGTNMTFGGTGSGTVTLTSAGTVTQEGTASLTKNGSYMLLLSNASSYSGGTIINSGAVVFASAATLPPGSGNITVNDAAVVWFVDRSIPAALNTASTGGLVIGADTNANFSGLNMTLVAASNSIYSATYTPFGTTYKYGAMPGATLTVTNQLSGANSLKVGPSTGTVVLTNINTFTGPVEVYMGTLQISDARNMGSGATLTLSGGGTLKITANVELSNQTAVVVSSTGGGLNTDPSTLTIDGVVSGDGTLTVSGGGLLWLKSRNPLTGRTVISSGTVLRSDFDDGLSNSVVTIGGNNALLMTNAAGTAWTIGGLDGPGAIALTNNAAAAVTSLTLGSANAGATADYSNTLYGLSTLTKKGANIQELSGADTSLAGETITVNDGVLQFNSAGAIGGSGANVTPNYGGTAAAGYPMDQAFLDRIAPASAGVVALASNSVGNALSLAALSDASLGGVGAVLQTNALIAPYGTGNDKIYRLGGGNGTLTIVSTLGATVNSNSTVVIDDHGTAGGTIVLQTNNNFRGPLIISNGTVLLRAPLSWGVRVTQAGNPTNLIQLCGGTLNNNQIMAATVDVINASTFVAAGGELNERWRGTGTVSVIANVQTSFRGANRYHELVGTFAFGNSSGSWRPYLGGNQFIHFTNVLFSLGNNSFGITMRDTHSMTMGGLESDLAGTNTYIQGANAGANQFDSNEFLVGFNNLSTTFSGSIRDGPSPNTNTRNGHNTSFTKMGTGTLTLVGDNNIVLPFLGGTVNRSNVPLSMSGLFTISNGYVVLGSAVSAPKSGTFNVVVNNGLIFSNGVNWEIGGLGYPWYGDRDTRAGTGDIALANVFGAAVTLTVGGNNGSTICSNNISGPGKLIKIGNGILSLAGSNSYAGGTDVQAGTLGFGSFAAFSSAGGVNVSSNASIGIFFTNVQNAINLGYFNPAFAGGLAISAASANESINFNRSDGQGLTNAWLVAAETMNYTGVHIPFTNNVAFPVYRLGASAGSTLTYTQVLANLNGLPTSVMIGGYGGTVTFWAGTRIVTNTYSGGTTINGPSALYIRASENLGADYTTVTLSNAVLRITNSFVMKHPIVLRTRTGFGVIAPTNTIILDAPSVLTITQTITAVGGIGGPLGKDGGGQLIIASSAAGNTYNTAGGTVLQGGSLIYANAAAAPANNSVVVNAGTAIGFQFTGVEPVLLGVVANAGSSDGSVALFATNANDNFNFNAAGIARMSLAATENMTYNGTYIGWSGGLGVNYRLAALPNITLNVTRPLTNYAGGSSLLVGGFLGGFTGTVQIFTNSTITGDNVSGVGGFGQVTVKSGTLYIDRDAALGDPGDGQYLDNGGIVLSNGILRVTNSFTLDNRRIQFPNSAGSGITVDGNSTLIITNIMDVLGDVGGAALTFTKRGNGLLWLTYTDSPPCSITNRIDVTISGGVLRSAAGTHGRGDTSYNFVNYGPGMAFGSTTSNGVVDANGGVWEVTTGSITNPLFTGTLQRSGALQIRGAGGGVSAYGVPLVVALGEGWGATNVPGARMAQWGDGNMLDATPLILNQNTANANLTWLNPIDLGAVVSNMTLRRLAVNASPAQQTFMFGVLQSSVNTTNALGLGLTSGGLIKEGVGRLAMLTNNPYNGPTIIREGSLELMVNPTNTAYYGGIPATAAIVVGTNAAAPAFFDVTAVNGLGDYVIGGGTTNQAVGGVGGSIRGDVRIGPLASLNPGDTVAPTNYIRIGGGTLRVTNVVYGGMAAGVGTLTFSNSVIITNAVLNYDLGTASDTVNVTSNLTLKGGTLNVRDSGGFGGGSYTLFSYGGALSYETVAIGTIPPGTWTINTNTPGLVTLNGVGDPWAQWLLNYFGASATNDPAFGTYDSDGDGMNNTNEFLAGTVPTNSVSALRITSVVKTGNDVVITWRTAGGKTNVVQSTGGAGGSYSNNFVDIVGATIAITGSGDQSTNYTDVGGATNVPSWYYRIRLVP